MLGAYSETTQLFLETSFLDCLHIMPFREFRKKTFYATFLLFVTLGIALGINACVSPSNDKSLEATKSPVPIFLFIQASPDGKTIEGIVPSDLVEQLGSLDRVIQSIPVGSQFAVMQFGKPLGMFQVSAVRGSEAFGAIASFKVQAPSDGSKSPSAKAFDPTILKQPNLTIVASDRLNTSSDRTYFFNCPNKIQPLVLEKSRNLFLKLGANQGAISQVAIASLSCIDIDGDNQPEIIAGLRLDNPIRPVGFDPQLWKEFLSRPALERQEYSLLVMLRKSGNDWTAEPILTHTRALSYINDSVSSYALFGIQEINGDRYPEIVVKEIGLNSVDVRVFTPNVDPTGNWQWRSYYQNQKSLNIVQ
ncbi:hypothetical protein H6F42_01210 [Pseudanabaena sp. FACHB-1998]|uniref:hypothetical protein n=1 Tax=Pseudanabaena sp. FACHB-1998 TaxID=2692858 RepID=UPI00168138C1|nr:hypothetical protein [Pseudanabaena sp. FACHB-1998]MBD2175534.1 hypothetical protein [Pseudanabaena sp. FACHB-1998]